MNQPIQTTSAKHDLCFNIPIDITHKIQETMYQSESGNSGGKFLALISIWKLIEINSVSHVDFLNSKGWTKLLCYLNLYF